MPKVTARRTASETPGADGVSHSPASSNPVVVSVKAAPGDRGVACPPETAMACAKGAGSAPFGTTSDIWAIARVDQSSSGAGESLRGRFRGKCCPHHHLHGPVQKGMPQRPSHSSNDRSITMPSLRMSIAIWASTGRSRWPSSSPRGNERIESPPVIAIDPVGSRRRSKGVVAHSASEIQLEHCGQKIIRCVVGRHGIAHGVGGRNQVLKVTVLEDDPFHALIVVHQVKCGLGRPFTGVEHCPQLRLKIGPGTHCLPSPCTRCPLCEPGQSLP